MRLRTIFITTVCLFLVTLQFITCGTPIFKLPLKDFLRPLKVQARQKETTVEVNKLYF